MVPSACCAASFKPLNVYTYTRYLRIPGHHKVSICPASFICFTFLGCSVPYRTSIERAAASDPGTPLILVNGVGQTGLGFNWGDGFATDAQTLTSAPAGVSDPRGFFGADDVVTRGFRTVLAPHSCVRAICNGADSGKQLWQHLVGAVEQVRLGFKAPCYEPDCGWHQTPICRWVLGLNYPE